MTTIIYEELNSDEINLPKKKKKKEHNNNLYMKKLLISKQSKN